MMKFFLQYKLAWFAKRIMAKYQPAVVAVTGSVGKTSTRNAIAVALGAKFRVRSPKENYNNEFGVPFTVIGVPSPGRSVFGWLRLFAKAAKLLLVRDANYPNMLVLEFGIDHPGDMAYLCDLARPDVAVFTAVSPVHAENFGSLEALIREKVVMIESVPEDGLVVLNADDPNVMAEQGKAKARVMTFGFSAVSDVRGENVGMKTREDGFFESHETFAELSFDVVDDEGRETIVLENRLGSGVMNAVLAAVAVARQFGITLEEAAAVLAKHLPIQPGRLNLLAGIKGSLILDDSYNAAPASMKVALDVLGKFSPFEFSRRIAVLGSMAELGAYSEEAHREIGMRAAEVADLLVAVGEKAKGIVTGAKEAGMMDAQIQWFADSIEAGRALDAQISKGDIILVKGSQSARMERVTKDVMADPLRAPELLVRQYGKWVRE